MTVSPEVMRWVRALEEAERRPTGISDDEAGLLAERREKLMRCLAVEPNRSPADAAAKLAILCRRLRQDANPGSPWSVANYLLAESARDGWPA